MNNKLLSNPKKFKSLKTSLKIKPKPNILFKFILLNFKVKY